jgi:fatty acid-binding protein DegV
VDVEEKHLLLKQDVQINDLRRQKQALEAAVESLKQSTSNHNAQLKVMHNDYQTKLQTLTQKVCINSAL